MNDSRISLPPNTVIEDFRGIKYKILSGDTGQGGSSLVYKASREDNLRIFVIKEYYPLKRYNLVRKNGILYPEDENITAEEYFEQVKNDMLHENDIGQLISNSTGRMIASWEILKAAKIILDGKSYDAKNGYFIVMEQATDKGWFLNDLLEECAKPIQEGMPLRNNGMPSPYVATCIIEELLKSLREIHRAGFLHGDIQDGNLFFMGANSEEGDIGVGQLIDFATARKILFDGKTEVIIDRNIFTTPGYWSPEILNHNDGNLRLTLASDIYSTGCLMLYLMKGFRYKNLCGRNMAKSFSSTVPVSLRELIKHGYRREAATLFKKILVKALKRKPEDRYKNAGEMLKDMILLKKLTAPPKFILSQNLSRSPYFVNGSRDKEIAILQEQIENGESVLYIWGLGGIGKTELAMELARKQIENGMPAYMVTFNNSMKETILHMNFSGYQFEFDGSGDPTEAEYRERIDLLKENYKNCLLIVDNFEHEDKDIAQLQQETAYKDVISLGINILFTTRSRPNNSSPELMPIDEENAFILFNSITKVTADEEKFVKKLIHEVDCHPMTVELLAHTIEESWNTISPKDLLVRLKNDRLDSQNLPKVTIKKGHSSREAKIYGHLRTLFNLFYLDESYREILAHTTLLPVDGFNAAEFLLSENAIKKKQLKRIEGHGWIRRRHENNVLWIHPLIRSIIKDEIRPINADCEEFLSTLWNKLDEKYPPDIDLFRQSAELYERAANDLGDEKGEHLFHAGYCYINARNSSQAFLIEEKAVKIREKALDPSDPELARTYNDAGVASLWFYDIDRAMDYFNKATKVLEIAAPDDPNAANIFANVGTAYANLGDYDKAINFAEKAVAIFKNSPPKNRFEQVNALETLGHALMGAKRYAEAMPHMKNASTLMEILTPNGSPDLAMSYRYIGELYALSGQAEEALNYVLKTISLQEKFLPKNHSDIIASYSLIGEIYRVSGNASESKKYIDKASLALKLNQEKTLKENLRISLDIIETSEHLTNDNFIHYCRGIADIYRRLDDLKNAKLYIFPALEKISHETNPTEASLTYLTMADICSAQKDFNTALNYTEKSLKIIETHFPKDFANLSTICLSLGNLHKQINDLVQALFYYEKSIEFQLQCQHPDYDFVDNIQSNVGIVLKDLGQLDRAEKVFENLLEKLKALLPDFHRKVKNIQVLLDEVRKMKYQKTETK